MQLSKKEILNLLAHDEQPLHFAGLLRAFGGRHIKNELKRLLDDLITNGELIRLRGNRYSLPGAETSGTVHGSISVHRDGYGFVAPEGGGDDIFVPARPLAARCMATRSRCALKRAA